MLAEIRRRWMKESHFVREFDMIETFYRLASDERMRERLDDRTWSDLDMDDVFCQLDRNVTALGRQYLYRMLRYFEDDETILASRTDQYKLLTDNPDLRENIQLILTRLSSDAASSVVHLIFDHLPRKPKHFWLIYVSSAMMFIFTAMTFLVGQFFLFCIFVVAIINFVIHAVYERRIFEHFGSLSYFRDMLGAASSLAELETECGLHQLQYLKRHKDLTETLQKQIGWLVMDTSRLDMFTGFLVIYLNYFGLLDIIVAFRSLKPLEEHREDSARIFEAVASLDAMISVASWQASLPQSCVPRVHQDRTLEAESMYHPLPENPIANTISLDDESVLVTGSNMSGKTTFIKTIGVNVVLGRTLHVCLAETCVIPAAVVKSSITREENLSGDESYYFAEVNRLRDFIELVSNEGTYLLLIDEIYRGTNTVERISAGQAVLAHLADRAMVMATTHDIELQELLEGRYRMHHFSEQVSEENFYFDYRLREGPTKSRNAIKLLELSGYPESVTKQANTLADRLSRDYDQRSFS